MKEQFKLLASDHFIRVSLLLSLLFLIPLITIIILTYNLLPPLIPFYNSMPWGEERLAPSTVALVLPLLLMVVFVSNVFIAAAVYKKFALISRIALFNCSLFLLLGLLAFLQILFLTY